LSTKTRARLELGAPGIDRVNTDLLIKLSPLAIATLHGYGAAWLAVKMLFRPRRPVTILGYRLPLTPGMLPKEREHFIEALASVIARRLLDVETIADEIAKLNLEGEITSLARREYLNHSQKETTIARIVEHIRSRLHTLRDSQESRSEIAVALRKVVDAEVGRRFSLLRRMIVDYLLDEKALDRIIGDSIAHLAEQITDSLYVRATISQAMAQIPEAIFAPEGGASVSAINQLVSLLSQRLDFRSILIKRLSELSNEEIEGLIMETAGKEIRAIVWFGAGIGLIVGVIQTVINFL
jgi:uncharacterized membrane protein YheB (UPF0754 family)